MLKLSIRTQLTIIIGFLCLLTLFYSAGGVFDAFTRSTQAKQIVALTQVSRELMRNLLGVRLERSTMTIPLGADAVVDPYWTTATAANRTQSETAYAKIQSLVDVTSSPAIASAMQKVAKARDRVLPLRVSADAALQVVKAKRDSALVPDINAAMTEYLDALTAATNVIDTAIRKNDAVVDQYLAIKRAGWTGRVTAGGVAGRIQNGISAGKPWTLTETMEAAEERGRMTRAWADMQEIIDASTLPQGVIEAHRKANEQNYIGAAAAERKALSEALSSGRPTDVVLKDLQARDTANQQTIVDLAYVALDEMVSRAQTIESDASFMLTKSIAIFVACIGLALLSLYVVFRGIAGPLVAMSRSVSELAAGNLSVDIPSVGRADEIGGIAASVAVFKDRLIRTRDLEAEAVLSREANERKRKDMLTDLAASFEASVGAIVQSVASSAHDLEDAARLMSHTAVETSHRSTAVAAAAEEAATNVTMVAASAEELGASVTEIGRQVQSSAHMSTAAVTEATETAAIVRELSHSAGRISDVLALISTIAGQTNLLALNATIEAARAGESGRGFAVVASEVKELANQTAKATAEISEQVSAIQSSTDRAVSAIGAITATIGQLNDGAALISASVAEQGSATSEIVRNISQASSGTGDVTDNIAGVARAAAESGSAAEQVLASSGDLAHKAEQMRAQVERFLSTVRAA